MAVVQEQAGVRAGGGPRIVLRPLRGGEVWEARLEDGLFSLHAPDGRLVLMLPNDQAVRHLRFSFSFVHGAVLRVMVVEGLRAHTFKVAPEDRALLLAALPRRSEAALEREATRYGAAVVLLGVLHLVFPDLFYREWGLLLVAAGIAGILFPRPRVYLVYGSALALVGLLLLASPSVTVLDTLGRVLYAALGSVCVLWGIQQFTLLRPQHTLQPAYDPNNSALSTGQRHRSPLVQAVALCAGVFTVLFAGYAGVVHWAGHIREGLFNDYLICGGLAALMGMSGVVLMLRKRPPYLEAKVTAQLLIVVAVLYAWGMASGFVFGNPLAVSHGVLAAGLLEFERPYVWAPVIVLVLLFNQWFIGAVEREVQEHG